MPNPLAITTLHASGAETANGNGTSVDLGDRTFVELVLDVSAFAGTNPTLAVVLEHSLTGTLWATVGTFAVASSVTSLQLTVPDTQRFIRAKWTITGTAGPSFTFALTGTAHQLYCTPNDLTRFGIPAPALDGVSTSDRAQACLVASEEAAGYLASAYTLPLTAWDVASRGHVARIAAYQICRFRGYDPDSGKDDLLQRGYDQAIAWFNRIAAGKLRPVGIIDTLPLITEPEVYVESGAPRGWGR